METNGKSASELLELIWLEPKLEKYNKVIRLLEERNWQEMEEWLHGDFMDIKETSLSDRQEHIENKSINKKN